MAPSEAAPRCNSRKSSCSTDGVAPTISISAPAAGATVSGAVTVSGAATDNGSLARVDVAVDGGAFRAATGTLSWSSVLDTTLYPDGNHTIVARATDAAGNTGTVSRTVTVGNTTANPEQGVITNPVSGTDVVLLGRGRMAESGSLSLLLYQDGAYYKPWAYVRDATSGAVSHVPLPYIQTPGSDWSFATPVLAGNDLWVHSGGGPVHVRHYRLSGSPLPTSATLLSSVAFGDADSRAGDLVRLQSGALVAAWHQQGQLGDDGQAVSYLPPGGGWSSIGPLRFMPTTASWQVAAQHPADGSVWVFSDADAWGAIGAIHLSETPAGLSVDWTHGSFINSATDGLNGPDPENPDLQAVADPSTGTIALAYQSRDRTMFSTSPFVAGSRVAVARVTASGAKSFVVFPTHVERVSRLGLVVRPGETWLAYRPVDLTDLSFDDLFVSRHVAGAWEAPARLGTLKHPYAEVVFGQSRPEFAAPMSGGKVHFFGA